jgi:ferredoxin/flavodoxin
MNPTIFYFTASGNSLAVARDITTKTGGKLVFIPTVMNKQNIHTESDVIGIVFPVYYASNDCGVPLIIQRFINKLEDTSSKYVFAVCTHSGMAGTTIENLKKLLRARGGELAAGFSINMGSTQMPDEKQQKILVNQQKKTDFIAEYVLAQKRGKVETRGLLRKIVFAPVLFLVIKPIFSRRYRQLSNTKQHVPFPQMIPTADNSYQCDETKCKSCGVCVKVCPVDNIKLVNGRPVWLHHCETCYACYLWCPNNAISGKIVEYNDKYHHPYVGLLDMVKQNQPLGSRLNIETPTLKTTKSIAANSAARPKIITGPNTTAPATCPNISPKIGSIKTTLICCASLKPFTREEMMTVKPMLASATAGAKLKIIKSQSTFGSSNMPNMLNASTSNTTE